MNYKEYVEDLKGKCEAFLMQVESIGNECAWTDRALEGILAAADDLRQLYYGPEVAVALDMDKNFAEVVDFRAGYYEWNLTFGSEVIFTVEDGSGYVTNALADADIDELYAFVDECIEDMQETLQEEDKYEFSKDELNIIRDKMREAFSNHFGIADRVVTDLLAEAYEAAKEAGGERMADKEDLVK